MGDWISVNNYLPKNSYKPVLIKSKKGMFYLATYNASYGEWIDDTTDEVIADDIKWWADIKSTPDEDFDEEEEVD